MVSFERFVNEPIDSVTYIIYNESFKSAIIVDPGTENDERLISFLKEKELVPTHIILTHEHFDHILGVNFLRSKLKHILLASSEKTSSRLGSPKKNLAVFYNQTFLEVGSVDIFLEEGNIELGGLQIEVLETPGHTDSSLSFIIDHFFITGDFILKNERLITNLPTGSKKDYKKSFIKIQKLVTNKLFLPGHGEPFYYEESLFEIENL